MSRNLNTVSREEATRRFSVGQMVRMKSGRPMNDTRSADTYHITAVLPPAGGRPQYRIRNRAESHERMATHDRLEPVMLSEDARNDALLIAKTFGPR
ncbi:hypothetical protein [uncultured Roseibium sp.]|uniref:hypothetical protein n=1 Tax=uncultured Roseibium sp. TaxID=1936171 RepID=UPI003216AD38